MIVNIGLYVFGSLYFKQSQEEQSAVEDFVGALTASTSRTRYADGNRTSICEQEGNR